MQQSIFTVGQFMQRLAFLCCLALAIWVPSVEAATYTNSSTTYNWIDPSTHTKVGYKTAPYKLNSCGTAVPVLDDTISDIIPIGWNFLYGTTSYNSLRIETNGRLQFNNPNCGAGTQNIGPPQTYTYLYPVASMNNTMKAFGVDLDPTNLVDKPNYPSAKSKTSCTSSANCYITYASIGTAPNRQFVVSWVNVPEWVTGTNTSGSFTFQIILNEDGSFLYQYKTIVHGGTGQAQIGWQLTTGDFSVLTFGAATEPGAPAAILFYIPSGSPLAEYQFEEGAWAPTVVGQVNDSSAKALHGMSLGLAQETASGKVCRGASMPLNTTGATVDAIKTGVRFADAGVNMAGQGTAMFWYKSNLAWNSGQAAQLLDATLTNGQWFYLTKTATGTLYFQVTDSTGALRSVETSAQAFAANTWVHVAISWNFNASPTANSDHLQIFVDGAAPTPAPFTSSGSLATLDYVHVGDNPSGFTGTKGTVNSANGTMDELRLYNSELNQGQVLGIRSATHSCGSYVIDHLELRPASWSGNACAPGTMVLAACANSTVGPSCTPYTKGLVATLSSTGAATLWDAATGGTSIVIGYGQSSANKSFYAAAGTATINAVGTGDPPIADGAIKCIVGGVSGSCNWTSANGGLVLTVPASGVVTAGKSTSVAVQAVHSSGPTPGAACVPVQNLSTAGLKVWTTPSSPTSFAATSTSASVTVGGAPQVANALAGTYATTPQVLPASNNVTGLSFDGTATTALWLKHMDTGQFALNATLDVAATATAPVLNLSGTAGVTVIPVGYGVSATAVQASTATQTACATFPLAACDTAAGGNARGASAGGTFATTVNAVLWTADADTDFADNPVTPSYAGSVALSPTLVAPAGGATGALASTTAVLVAGTSTNASQSWTQAGAMKITASGSYFGQSVTGQSVVLGRFSPRNFTTTLTTAGCGTFTYSGQAMTVVTVKAMDGASVPAVTPNYVGAFARPVTLTDASATTSGAITLNSLPAANFASGVGLATPVYTFTNKQTAPATLILRASDGEVTSAGYAEAAPPVRSGRIRVGNAYGSELLATGLRVPTVIEYYDTSPAAGWRTGTDTCTVITPGNFAFAFPVNAKNHLTACETAVTATGANPSPVVTLSSPGVGNAGWTDLTLNLGVTGAGSQCVVVGGAGGAATTVNTTGAPWLRYPWAGAGDVDPTARATFGVFRTPITYSRENY